MRIAMSLVLIGLALAGCGHHGSTTAAPDPGTYERMLGALDRVQGLFRSEMDEPVSVGHGSAEGRVRVHSWVLGQDIDGFDGYVFDAEDGSGRYEVVFRFDELTIRAAPGADLVTWRLVPTTGG